MLRASDASREITGTTARRRAQASPSDAPAADGTSMSSDSYRASERPRNAREFSPFLMNQYDGADLNACGTTSMSMLLNFWKGEPGEYSHQKLDRVVRQGPDMFSSPLNLRDYARSQGFRSEVKNNANLDDLKGYVDKGAPVQVLYDPDGDGSDSTLHYVNVIDYKADDQGNITDLVIADPAGGKIKTVSREEFQRRWDNVEFMNLPTGVNNMMIVTLPGENTPMQGKDGKTYMSDDLALPPRASFLERALGIEAGPGIALADGLADLVNEAVTVKDQVVDAAKTVWRSLSSL